MQPPGSQRAGDSDLKLCSGPVGGTGGGGCARTGPTRSAAAPSRLPDCARVGRCGRRQLLGLPIPHRSPPRAFVRLGPPRVSTPLRLRRPPGGDHGPPPPAGCTSALKHHTAPSLLAQSCTARDISTPCADCISPTTPRLVYTSAHIHCALLHTLPSSSTSSAASTVIADTDMRAMYPSAPPAPARDITPKPETQIGHALARGQSHSPRLAASGDREPETGRPSSAQASAPAPSGPLSAATASSSAGECAVCVLSATCVCHVRRTHVPLQIAVAEAGASRNT